MYAKKWNKRNSKKESDIEKFSEPEIASKMHCCKILRVEKCNFKGIWYKVQGIDQQKKSTTSVKELWISE